MPFRESIITPKNVVTSMMQTMQLEGEVKQIVVVVYEMCTGIVTKLIWCSDQKWYDSNATIHVCNDK